MHSMSHKQPARLSLGLCGDTSHLILLVLVLSHLTMNYTYKIISPSLPGCKDTVLKESLSI